MASVVQKVGLNDGLVSRGKRKNLCSKLRFRVLERDGYKCTYCGLTATEGRLEVDHVIPVSKGGTDTYKNLVAACRTCNVGKRDRLLGAPELDNGKPYRPKKAIAEPIAQKPRSFVWMYQSHPLFEAVFRTLKECRCDACFYTALNRAAIAPYRGLHSWHLVPYGMAEDATHEADQHFNPTARAGELA